MEEREGVERVSTCTLTFKVHSERDAPKMQVFASFPIERCRSPASAGSTSAFDSWTKRERSASFAANAPRAADTRPPSSVAEPYESACIFDTFSNSAFFSHTIW